MAEPRLQDGPAYHCTPSDTAWPEVATKLYEEMRIDRRAHWTTVRDHALKAVARVPELQGATVAVGSDEQVTIVLGQQSHTGVVLREPYAAMVKDIDALVFRAAQAFAVKPEPLEAEGPAL